MKGRKYMQNKKPLSEAEMDKFKDFDGVMEKLDGGPEGQADNGNSMNAFSSLGKGIFVFIGLAAIVWIVASKLSSKQPDASKELLLKDSTEQIIEASYKIEPPLAGHDVPYETFTINAGQDVELKSKSGSHIRFAANTFSNNKGELVEGEVTVMYREFHNPLDIFKSGIPMQYDSAGVNYTFESAGMFEFFAMQDGEKLNTKLEKEVVVDLVSQINSLEFNHYYFDEVKGEWLFEEKVEPVAIDQVQETIHLEKEKIEEVIVAKQEEKLETPLVKVEAPIVFPKVIREKYAFEIDYDTKSFPELRKGVVFQVDEERSSFSSVYYDVNWESVQLKRSNIKDRYKVILKKAGKTIEVECFPAMSDKEYKVYKTKYDKELRAYKEYLNKVKGVGSGDLRPALSKTERRIEDQIVAKSIVARFKAKRRFTVKNTGFYNCDCPRNLRLKGRQVFAKFNSDRGRVVVRKVYNSMGKDNMLLTSLEEEVVNYKPNIENTLWAITETEQIAIAEKGSFDKIKGKHHNFTMTVYETENGLKVLQERLGIKN